ncbi:MAG: 3' terminal RNA ribose 2'-O-methyltransferase Hen1 [Pseudomonadota bacterium]
MQIEITLIAPPGADYAARDLGYLLHKNPAHVHPRQTAAGDALVFFPATRADRSTAVLHLTVDPVKLVRGGGRGAPGLIAEYVNDRPYVANSFLSVALARSFGQSLAGTSKERQHLADRALPFEARVTPVAIAGEAEMAERLFAPLGYRVDAAAMDSAGQRGIYDLRLAAEIRLAELLNHLYVLVPVLDNAKHWWIDRDEIDALLAKGAGWLATHPERDVIAKRSLKHRRALVAQALERLAEDAAAEEPPAEEDETTDTATQDAAEATLERPIRLHDLRLETVADTLRAAGARRVLDLGCGAGKLLSRLVKDGHFERLVGVDPSARALEVAARRLRLDQAGEALRARLGLMQGSLTYGDRRWEGFDAAALVEVIEHIEPARLSSLALALFAAARPRTVVVTTPNREYNVLFDGMAPGARRHGDHRFEWTRAEFAAWGDAVADAYGYAVRYAPIGPEDATHGAPSQMAVFTLGTAAAEEAA